MEGCFLLPKSEFWKGLSGPTSFGSGGFLFSDSGSGNFAGVFGAAAEGGNLFVTPGYVSGTPLGVSTATWSNQTFATLGVTPGTYVWTWGTGMNADSFTLQIGPAAPANGVPEPGSTIMLMLGAIGTLAAFRRKLAAGS